MQSKAHRDDATLLYSSTKVTRLIVKLDYEVHAQPKLTQLLPRWPDTLAADAA
jgi:hypothetical protein